MSEYVGKKRKEETNLSEKLKVCPVCKSVSFADMETCFSCLYRFDKEEAVLCCESDSETFQDASKEDFDRDGNPSSIKETFVVEGIEQAPRDNKALHTALGAVSFIDEGFEISIAVRPLRG